MPAPSARAAALLLSASSVAGLAATLLPARVLEALAHTRTVTQALASMTRAAARLLMWRGDGAGIEAALALATWTAVCFQTRLFLCAAPVLAGCVLYPGSAFAINDPNSPTTGDTVELPPVAAIQPVATATVAADRTGVPVVHHHAAGVPVTHHGLANYASTPRQSPSPQMVPMAPSLPPPGANVNVQDAVTGLVTDLLELHDLIFEGADRVLRLLNAVTRLLVASRILVVAAGLLPNHMRASAAFPPPSVAERRRQLEWQWVTPGAALVGWTALCSFTSMHAPVVLTWVGGLAAFTALSDAGLDVADAVANRAVASLPDVARRIAQAREHVAAVRDDWFAWTSAADTVPVKAELLPSQPTSKIDTVGQIGYELVAIIGVLVRALVRWIIWSVVEPVARVSFGAVATVEYVRTQSRIDDESATVPAALVLRSHAMGVGGNAAAAPRSFRLIGPEP
ncbi:hypothetical protein AMAG_00623 [Allomyces macrogynus ATCC 38327]|uniref:Uncharacterized protein n=1 Tax=Allomyces macrogynus (strain ATCC 38327) TaxID=578462 RepID=A0A0L0RX08_ALLM3|nr:hypothetical protein AMAG_00623 [Allomyces macrogynus ATCC 38327]|eukprot:KNE54665.1 hypothetical protein AMAG_00623 [Allomyces macrogynus ATCC 38327]